MSNSEGINLWELSDLTTPWCIRVASTLRIANHLQSGVDQIDDLARAAGCDAEALHRVLGHLASIGVFEEPSPGIFALNDVSRQLLDPITQVSLDLEDLGGRFAGVWGTLLAYVRTGKPAYADQFGLPFWQDLQAHPRLAESFDRLIGPEGHGVFNPEIELTGGWDAIRTVVDVGGGTGAMLAAVLQAHPDMNGILVDLPRTVARSADIFQIAGVTGRAAVSGQSFFDPLPPGADLYILRGILNDWPDPQALEILRRCAEAARPNGRIVVLKGIDYDDEPQRLEIEMVLTGGKYRKVSEFRILAAQAGLEVIAAGRQSSGYFVVECRPA